MRRFFACLLCKLILIGFIWPAQAQSQEKRIALVVGNAGYQAGALKTSANDAGLIAQTLQAAGFDVVGARDLDQDALRRTLRDFLSKASSSGPDTVAFIYLSGYGLQLEGENYFLPIDAKIGRAADAAAEALRISDYIRPLATLKLKASMVVLDAARRNPFTISGEPLAGGLALVEPSPESLVAFNAAPGTIAPDENGPYGAYAQGLAEMMREGGLTLTQVFERARLRVSDMTKGTELPWFSSRIDTAFAFFERSRDAPVPAVAAAASADIAFKSIRELPAADAYVAAVERDTLQGYEEFLAAYPDDSLAKRVRAIIAARREAITWQRTYAVNTPNAYWSYLRRYPHGPHSADARRRLALRAFALEPPASFDLIDYDVPPPPAEEEVYVDRPVLAFDDVDFGFVPPPPVPVYFLPPPPPEFVVLAAPLPVVEEFVLPVPIFVPIPAWCDPPAYVIPPANNVIFANIHNTIIVNRETNLVTIRNRHGEIVTSERRGFEPRASELAPSRSTGALRLAGLGLAAALPPSLAQKHAFSHPKDSASAQSASRLPLGRPLPGMQGQPLPPLSERLSTAPVTGSHPRSGVIQMPVTTTPPQPPPRPMQTHAPNLTPRVPSAAAAVRPPPPPPGPAAAAIARPASAPAGAYRLPSTPSAPYRPPSQPVVHAAPPPVSRPPAPPVNAAASPVFRAPAPTARAVAPPVFRAPAPPVVHAAPPPIFHSPAPVVRAAPAPPPALRPPAPAVHVAPPPPAAVAHRPPPGPGGRG